jgi:hypothetical protein
MAIGDYDALTRAAGVLRSHRESGWDAIEDTVISVVRSTPRGSWPLKVDDPQPYSAPGELRVSELVLGAKLSRALAGDPDYALLDIDVASTDAALQRISVSVSGRYLADLRAAAERITARCDAVIHEVIGERPGVALDVDIIDVHRDVHR